MDGGLGEFLLLIPEWMDVYVISCWLLTPEPFPAGPIPNGCSPKLVLVIPEWMPI
jgi:hypothetical protein